MASSRLILVNYWKIASNNCKEKLFNFYAVKVSRKLIDFGQFKVVVITSGCNKPEIEVEISFQRSDHWPKWAVTKPATIWTVWKNFPSFPFHQKTLVLLMVDSIFFFSIHL